MLSITYSAAASGVDGYEIRVECAAKKGLPSFEIVGLPDAAVRESEKRIFTSPQLSEDVNILFCDSLTAASGSPSISNDGRPFLAAHSTRISFPSTPDAAAE